MRQLAAILLVALLACGCVQIDHKPKPTPDPAVTTLGKVSHDATVDYSHRVGDVFSDVASKIESGDIKTEVEAHQALKDGNAQASKDGFAPVGQAIQNAFGDGDFNPTKAAKVFREISSGHKAVK